MSMSSNHRPGSIAMLAVSVLSVAAASNALAESAPSSGPRAGEAFDAVPFSLPIEDDSGRSFGVRWAEPRKIRRVVVEFPAGVALPAPDQVRVQYWHGVWDAKPEPILSEKGAGGVGWERMDDWTNGKWRDADTRCEVRGNRWTFTFAPTGEKEFPNSAPGVAYRKTIQLRLMSNDQLPRRERFQAFTDSVYLPLTVRIVLGKPAHPAIRLSEPAAGHLEAFNGAALAVRPGTGPLAGDSDRLAFKTPMEGESTVEADLLMTADQLNPGFDRTIVTVRADGRPFSFAADEVARGDRILIDDLGVLVVRADDPITLEGYRAARKEFAGRTVYRRVFDQAEQTLTGAWDAMPLKRPLYFVHGLPGNRNAMHQNPNGDIVLGGRRRWFRLPPSPKDTERRAWEGELLTLGFGFPNDHHVNRRFLKDGFLPLLTTCYRDGELSYEQHTILDSLRSDLAGVTLDDPGILLMRVRIVNLSADKAGTARLLLTSQNGREKLSYVNGRVLGKFTDQDRLRYMARNLEPGQIEPQGNGLRWTRTLEPAQACDLYFLIPSIALDTPATRSVGPVAREPSPGESRVALDMDAEVAALDRRDFAADVERVCHFWEEVTARGCQIHTPEPWLNDFFKAHLRHLIVNCYQEIGTDRLHAHVGTFSYGVYPDESVMMIDNFDLRGYHELARRCYQSFLDYQGTVAMPGNFKSKEGTFYGAGGHSDGGYNKSHGWVLWGLAQHWYYTRDRTWMEQAAPKMVAGCEWVTRERQATMKLNPDGSRPIEYGFLPSGSLEDVTDYWTWMVTNACTDWGFSALAAALAEFDHPEAARLQAEAKAFHEDLMRGLEESRILAPVVRLRDGTYVPRYPSRLRERGRSHGWLRETLEGSIHLLISDLIDPKSPQADWILKDFEDNLYISTDYGYAIPSFDRFWFSRGGFSMQANLLGGPLPYLYRDEIKHFLRAYFNPFASAFYPDTRMCNEHSMPELGYPAGDHFKSSDEAQSTYWLRLMFVHERGGDLYLGQAIPRYWLAGGKSVGIERAATHFGSLSLRIGAQADGGKIKAVLDRPESSVNPNLIYLRLRHPDGKPIQSVQVNGLPHAKFDAAREWVILPGRGGKIEVEARY
ncbi:MAG: hypothetical protein HY718_05500 [Planctomycetes bacterium]|nr:hypothetical protein [Planctomycetota bacterium]